MLELGCFIDKSILLVVSSKDCSYNRCYTKSMFKTILASPFFYWCVCLRISFTMITIIIWAFEPIGNGEARP